MKNGINACSSSFRCFRAYYAVWHDLHSPLPEESWHRAA